MNWAAGIFFYDIGSNGKHFTFMKKSVDGETGDSFNISAQKLTAGSKTKKPVFGGNFSVDLGCILHHSSVIRLEKFRQANAVCKIISDSNGIIKTDSFCPNPHLLLTMMSHMGKDGMERVFWSEIHMRIMISLHDSDYPVDPSKISTLLASADPNKKSRGLEGTIQAGNTYQRDQQLANKDKYDGLLKVFKEQVCYMVPGIAKKYFNQLKIS